MSAARQLSGGGTAGRRESPGLAHIMAELSPFFLCGVRLTGRPSLGVGAYGSVEEMELEGMPCAGKRIHDILVDVGNEGAESMAVRFIEECRLMSELRHPHIVQFMGLFISSTSPLPILVMENLHSSLDDLLESTPDIPIYTKRSVLRDVALGLAYLHARQPPIIHRDLTARNVLLSINMQAKLADFGVARILNLPPGKLEATLTSVPGTSSYMPPEVFDREAKYSTSVDIFSFGHMALFTVTQVQPRVESATYVNPAGSIVPRSEVERREEGVSSLCNILGPEHPFLEIVKCCLQNNPLLRPTVQEVLSRIDKMKSSVRDPFYGLTRLKLTQMIRKKGAVNKKMVADLQNAQTDLLNAKKRILQLTEELQTLRLYQNVGDGLLSPPTTKEVRFRSISQPLQPKEDEFEAGRSLTTQHSLDAPQSFQAQPRSNSPNHSVPTFTVAAKSPQPPSPPGSPAHLSEDSSDNYTPIDDINEPPFLSLPPALPSRPFSTSSVPPTPDRELVTISQNSTSTAFPSLSTPTSVSRLSPLLRGFSSSDSDSDSNEYRPTRMRSSPLHSMPSFPPKGHSAFKSPNSPSTLSLLTPSSSRSTFSSSQRIIRTPSPSHQTATIASPLSLSTQHSSLSSPSQPSISSPFSFPPPQPLTTGMAGKLHFYTDLDSAAIYLLQKTEQGMIPGVQYDSQSGKVQIESDSSEKTDLASEKFRKLYCTVMTKKVSISVDVAADISQSAMEEIIQTLSVKFTGCAFLYDAMDSSIQVLGLIGKEVLEAKIAIDLALHKASHPSNFSPERRPKVEVITKFKTVKLSSKTTLTLKKGEIGLEDTAFIVCPNSSNLSCREGPVKLVNDLSCGTVARQCQAYIAKHGLLGFGHSLVTRAGGSLKCKYVIHGNTYTSSMSDVRGLLRKIMIQAIKMALHKGAPSIAFCPLIPYRSADSEDVVPDTMVTLLREFSKQRKMQKLSEVRIVVEQDSMYYSFDKLLVNL